MDNQKLVNILLLGEKGVGKTTFINSFANYIHFNCFETAIQHNPVTIVPTAVSVSNQDNIVTRIVTGSTETKNLRSYIFLLPEQQLKIQFIDTPGLGADDDLTFGSVLAHLTHLDELHAICFFMKPTTTGNYDLLRNGLSKIFSGLDKSVSKNLFLVLTNTKGTYYKATDTLASLMLDLEKFSSRERVEILLNHERVFCLDNEAYKYWIALRSNVTISPQEKLGCVQSWTVSQEECRRLITHVSNQELSPYLMKNASVRNDTTMNLMKQLIQEVLLEIWEKIRSLKKEEEDLGALIEESEDGVIVDRVQDMLDVKAELRRNIEEECCDIMKAMARYDTSLYQYLAEYDITPETEVSNNAFPAKNLKNDIRELYSLKIHGGLLRKTFEHQMAAEESRHHEKCEYIDIHVYKEVISRHPDRLVCSKLIIVTSCLVVLILALIVRVVNLM